jgi:transcriptional regulator GlxA family with amidase domain
VPELKYIGIYLFDQVEELDAIGPWEVLAYLARHFPDDGYRILNFSDEGGLVECNKGLVVQAQHSLADTPPLEILIYPGGKGTRLLMEDADHLTWLRGQRETVPLVTSVCTGALVLAKAGILHERPATTHWRSLDLLASIDDTIEVRRDDRFVDDGDVITSAGMSAGIDMAFHLIDRFVGRDRALAVQRAIQYNPEPLT